MIINLTPNWRITVDQHGNHTPERYVKRDGGNPIPGGKISKPFEGWETTNKYLSTVSQAINWIATNDCMGEDYDSLIAYQDDFERRVGELVNGLNGMQGARK